MYVYVCVMCARGLDRDSLLGDAVGFGDALAWTLGRGAASFASRRLARRVARRPPTHRTVTVSVQPERQRQRGAGTN